MQKKPKIAEHELRLFFDSNRLELFDRVYCSKILTAVRVTVTHNITELEFLRDQTKNKIN
jgi:sarcosine oxidase delta subunit